MMGAPLFVATDEDEGQQHVRARDRAVAKAQIAAKFPGCKFKR